MTSRGNSSISPPVQFTVQSQSRQVNALPSGTPPPQPHFFTGQTQPPIFELHSQPGQQPSQPLLTHQAYGSTHSVNDIRITGGNGRGASPQQALPQGGNFYQPNMRPQQPHQPQPPQGTYFITSTPNVRQQRPQQQQPQQQPTAFFMIPPGSLPAGTNVVIPTQAGQQNMHQYPRVPLFTPGQYSYQTQANYPQMFYQPSAAVRGTTIVNATQPARQEPQIRKKNIITIKDPKDGRDLTEELCQRPQSADSQPPEEQVIQQANQTSKEVQHEFVSKVAELLQTTQASNSASPNEQIQQSIESNGLPQAHYPPPPQNHPPQQNQPAQHPQNAMHPTSQPQAPHPQMVQPSQQIGHPHQSQQQQPAHVHQNMIRPHMMQQNPATYMNMVGGQGQPVMPQQQNMMPQQQNMMGQQPHSGSDMMGHTRPPITVNLAIPPPAIPQVRQQQPAQMFMPTQRHPQAPRPQTMPPNTPPPQQSSQPQIPTHQMQQHVPAVAHPPLVQTSSVPEQPAPPKAPLSRANSGPPATINKPVEQPQAPMVTNIPVSPTVAIPDKEPSPIKEASPPLEEAPLVDPVVLPVEEQSPPPTEDSSLQTDEDQIGASTQGKDVRKNKKKKSDFSRKDIGGSEMDAFIDGKDTVDSKNTPPLSATDQLTSVEKTVEEVAKPAFSYAAAANNDKPKQPTPEKEQTNGDSLPLKKEPASEVAELIVPINKKEPTSEPPPVKEETEVVATPPIATSVKSSEPSVQVPEPPKEEKVVQKVVPVLKSEPLESPKDNKNVAETIKSPKEDSPKVNDENVPPKDVEPEETAIEETQAGGPRVTRDASGRLIYQRQYLLELRSSDKSLARPVNLPDLEIILDNPMPVPQARSRATMSTGNMDFTPGYFIPTGGSSQRGPPMPKRGSQGGRPGERDMARMGPPQKVLTRQSMGNDVKPLHKAENAWVPKAKTGSKEDEAEKSLEAAVLFIMNRLTPTNFEKLAQDMRSLSLVKTYKDLEELVKIFFDKVTIETKFVSAYAQLCKVMAGMRVPAPPGLKDTQATFRVVLLTKCQQEFEADKASVFEDPEAKRKELQTEYPDTPDKAEKIDLVLYHMKLRRLKFYGNIRFIGELFKLNMLTENIMHDCIFRLLKAKDDDSLLSLCNLITTVGSHLDTEKAKARMDQYFNQMAKIAEEHKSRIKFTLKDVLDLRRNHWVPRKGETGPKKIDEVHKDFEKEQATKQFLASMPPPPRNNEPQPNSRRGSRQRPDQDKINDDGWNTVGTRSMRIDASKMKLSKPSVVDENSIQLGPGGGMNKFSMWSRGSQGAAQQSQQSQDDRQNAPSNRFSALRDDKDRRNFERSPSRENGGRGMRSGPSSGSRGKVLSRSSQEGERRDLLASARSIVGGGGRSQNASRDNSWNRDDRRQTFGPRGSGSRDPDLMTRSDITPQRPQREEFRTPVAPAPIKRVKEMSDEEIETKAKNNLEEYLNVRDLKEAKLCVSELAGQPKLYLMVTASYNEVLERTASHREATGNFMNELIKDNLISLDCYLQGLKEVLDYAEDMVIDIPMIWTYLGQVIHPLLVGASLPMASLLKTMSQSLEKRCCAKLLAQILTQIKDKKGEEAAAHKWQSGGSKWTEFLPAAEVADFLKDKRLEFVDRPSAPVGPNLEKLTEDVEAKLRDARPNREVIAFIEKAAGKDTQSNEFIRAITTAVASSAIMRAPTTQIIKANEDVIKSRKDILQHFIKSNSDLELQALYAVQALMTKYEHPPGVITCFFDTFYDEDVITEESCKQWEKSTDPAEQEGKGVCSMQLTQFFTWLSENDEPEAAS